MARKTDLTLTEMLLEMAENLTDNSIKGEELKSKIDAAQALSGIAEQVVNLKEASIRELDVNMKAVKTAASLGFAFKPQGLNLEALPQQQPEKPAKVEKVPKGYVGNDKKGITPEGFEYEL